MPTVACPSCGERGKIPPTLVGARIKCKKCGLSFQVAPPAAKAAVGAAVAGAVGGAVAAAGHHEGIAVEGLDASAWSASGDHSGELVRPVAETSSATAEQNDSSSNFVAHEPKARKEYKIICSRDKLFDGKFDIVRLEEAINFFARDGWVVKSMCTPHLKMFSETAKEEVVVLLER